MERLVLQLTDTCKCDFSMEYVSDPSLKCETDDNVAIFQARIVSTAENTSTEFLQLLQDWASTEPFVIVNGVHTRLLMECSAHINDIGETECIPSDAGHQNTTTTPQPSAVSLPAILIPTVIGTLILIALIIIIIRICRRKKPIELEDAPGERDPIVTASSPLDRRD